MERLQPPELSVQQGVYVVRLNEQFSHLYENMLERLQIITGLAESAVPPRVVVDMQHVQFVGSALLGFLMTAHRRLAERDAGRFGICGLNTFCRTALGVAKLNEILELFDTVDQAVQSLTADTNGDTT
ncbi:MAG: STAS domain-containing protein [Planctomycetaceae bacterium]|nr:STAS domain-containing protein [Planctomycetaceae bacterium]